MRAPWLFPAGQSGISNKSRLHPGTNLVTPPCTFRRSLAIVSPSFRSYRARCPLCGLRPPPCSPLGLLHAGRPAPPPAVCGSRGAVACRHCQRALSRPCVSPSPAGPPTRLDGDLPARSKICGSDRRQNAPCRSSRSACPLLPWRLGTCRHPKPRLVALPLASPTGPCLWETTPGSAAPRLPNRTSPLAAAWRHPRPRATSARC